VYSILLYHSFYKCDEDDIVYLITPQWYHNCYELDSNQLNDYFLNAPGFVLQGFIPILLALDDSLLMDITKLLAVWLPCYPLTLNMVELNRSNPLNQTDWMTVLQQGVDNKSLILSTNIAAIVGWVIILIIVLPFVIERWRDSKSEERQKEDEKKQNLQERRKDELRGPIDIQMIPVRSVRIEEAQQEPQDDAGDLLSPIVSMQGSIVSVSVPTSSAANNPSVPISIPEAFTGSAADHQAIEERSSLILSAIENLPQGWTATLAKMEEDKKQKEKYARSELYSDSPLLRLAIQCYQWMFWAATAWFLFLILIYMLHLLTHRSDFSSNEISFTQLFIPINSPDFTSNALLDFMTAIFTILFIRAVRLLPRHRNWTNFQVTVSYITAVFWDEKELLDAIDKFVRNNVR